MMTAAQSGPIKTAEHNIESLSTAAAPARRTFLIRSNLLVVNLLVIATGSYLVTKEPVKGYEPSIYESVGLLVWLLIPFAFAMTTILAWVETRPSAPGCRVPLHLASLVAISTFTFLLPVIRYGVVYDRWDAWYHIGATRDIAIFAIVNPVENLYPILHILAFAIDSMGGLDAAVVFTYVFPFVGGLYPLFMHVLAKAVWFDRRSVAIVALTSAVFLNVTGSVVKPQVLSVLVLPLVFYAYLMSRRARLAWQFQLITVTLVAIAVLSHVITGVVVASGFLLMEFASTRRAIKLTEKNCDLPRNRTMRGFVIYCWVVTVTWAVIASSVHASLVRALVEWDFQEMRYSDLLGGIGLSLGESFELFLIYYGSRLVVLGIATTGFLSWASNRRHKSRSPEGTNLGALYTFTIFAMLVLVVLDRTFALASFYHPDRFLRYVFVVMPATVPAVFSIRPFWSRSRALERNNRSDSGQRLSLVAIAVAFAIGIPAAFPSPFIHFYNIQVTPSEMATNVWLEGANDNMIKITGGNYHAAWYAGRNGNRLVLGRADVSFAMSLPNSLVQYACSSRDSSLMVVTEFDIFVAQRRGKDIGLELGALDTIARLPRILDSGHETVYLIPTLAENSLGRC